MQEEEAGDRPQKRARTTVVKCGSESSLLSSDTLCLGGISGVHDSRGGNADEPGVEKLCESVADAFRVGAGCRMEARPHQIDCIRQLLSSIHSGSCQQEPVNYLLQHRLFPNDLGSCLMSTMCVCVCVCVCCVYVRHCGIASML